MNCSRDVTIAPAWKPITKREKQGWRQTPRLATAGYQPGLIQEGASEQRVHVAGATFLELIERVGGNKEPTAVPIQVRKVVPVVIAEFVMQMIGVVNAHGRLRCAAQP
jgi:hypothetical protein